MFAILRLRNDNVAVNLICFQSNPEWQVISFNATSVNFTNSEDGAFSIVRFVLTIRRNSAYYIWVLIVPTFIISALCILGMFTPFSNTGERQEKVMHFVSNLTTAKLCIIISFSDEYRLIEQQENAHYKRRSYIIYALNIIVH